jgi:hypothetical protein
MNKTTTPTKTTTTTQTYPPEVLLTKAFSTYISPTTKILMCIEDELENRCLG